jgi:hypothetical protein
MLDLGTALPPFRLPRLGGGEVASSDFDGAPRCSWCSSARTARS